MVERGLNLEPEVQSIFKHIDAGRNFLLSGGAGSGKTYSLVGVIRQVILENPTVRVACMTYTNVAVKEIEERVNHKNLVVSTIHDFLWDNIKHFQKELKEAIITLANNSEVKEINIDGGNDIPETYFDNLQEGIQYKEFLRLSEGIISHDELLIISRYLFEKYTKLCSIVKDKYKFIFIDEYQDTSKYVIEIFLKHFKKSKKQNIIGLFGDPMQAIYDDGIGSLDLYKGDSLDTVAEIRKIQNRRNPQSVIELANQIRTDGLIQEHSTDINAPNMDNGAIKQGRILFLYSLEKDIRRVEKFLEENFGWDFDNSIETKELNLTHNLIADKAGFRTLMDIYDKDYILKYKDRIKNYIKKNNITTDFSTNTFGEVIQNLRVGKTDKELKDVSPTPKMKEFIDSNAELYDYATSLKYSDFSKLYIDKNQIFDNNQRDSLISHLCKIQQNIYLYKSQRYNEFLRATDYRYQFRNIASKKLLKDNIESLITVGDRTIEDIIIDADKKGICLIDDNLAKFIEKKTYIYNRVNKVQFSEFQNLYDFLEEKTPFSTQHSIKGAEFDNVLVVLDNGGWSKYNFQNLFLETGKTSVLDRTRKIFYVCCTRAKEHLAVFFHVPSKEVIEKAKKWFKNNCVINLDDTITRNV